MSELPSSHHRSVLTTAAVLAIVGWGGLALILTSTLPTLGPRWLFFFLLCLAATGTALPIIWLLHRRFDRGNPAPTVVLLRQGLWVGLFSTLCLWLQVNRLLSLQLTVLVAAGILVVEFLLRTVERSTWRPGK